MTKVSKWCTIRVHCMDSPTRALFRELIKHLLQGLSTEQIAREMDYPQGFLEQLLVREDFLAFFAEEEPEASANWQQTRVEEESDQIVQHYLREKSLHNAKKLQELADSGTLRPSEEKAVREILLKMSGTLKEEAVVEVVKISQAHLAALRESMAEVDGLVN